MAKPGGTFRNLLIWTYERGTLQYDIICTLILAFIFFVPQSCFVRGRGNSIQSNAMRILQHGKPQTPAAKSDLPAKNFE